MNRLQQLAVHRAALIERAAQQRSGLAVVFRQLERPAGVFDKGVAVARSVRSHPVIALTVGLAAMIYLRKHAGIGRLAGTAFAALRMGISFAKRVSSRKS